MRELIDIVTQRDSIVEAEQNPLRAEWYVLVWDGTGWNWSNPMTKDAAHFEYTKQVRVMPNAPSKMICVSTVLEEPGENADALSVPVK